LNDINNLNKISKNNNLKLIFLDRIKSEMKADRRKVKLGNNLIKRLKAQI
jgi:hypothetical protein